MSEYNPYDLANLSFEGNVVPHTWFDAIRLKNGKPDLVAITLLAEIAYWHRPLTVRDQRSGRVTGIRPKFNGDMWYLYYDAIEERFGLTHRQTYDALVRLEEQGLVKRIYETPTEDGQFAGKRVGVVLVTAAITAITKIVSPADAADGDDDSRLALQRNSDVPTRVTTQLGTPSRLALQRESYIDHLETNKMIDDQGGGGATEQPEQPKPLTKAETAAVSKLLQDSGVGLNAMTFDMYGEIAAQYGMESFIRGFTAAVENGKQFRVKYVEACVRNMAQGSEKGNGVNGRVQTAGHKRDSGASFTTYPEGTGYDPALEKLFNS